MVCGGKRETWQFQCVNSLSGIFAPLCLRFILTCPLFEEEVPCCFSFLSRFLYRYTDTRCHADLKILEEESQIETRDNCFFADFFSVLSFLARAFRSFCVKVKQLFSHQLFLQSQG